MSEYQYYEFCTVDRILTAKEQAEIKKLSSRVQLTSTQATFVYNYGDFRGDPEKVITDYFDIMFYVASWSTWRLMFRFPKEIADPKWFQPYELPDSITISTTPKYTVLDVEISDEEGLRPWTTGEGWLSRLLPLRDDLLQGDLRLLYLAWLRVAPNLAGYVLADDPVEPAIPPNLGQLSEPLKAFIEWVGLDADWVTVAAQASVHQRSKTEQPLENWLPALSEAEKQEFLLKLLRRESQVDLQLITRLQELAGVERSQPESTPGYRQLSDLGTAAQQLRTQRQRKEQDAVRKKRIRGLEALAPKEAQIWKKVTELIDRKQPKYYDEATALLKDLRDLAKHQGRSLEFTERFEGLRAEYQNRPALMTRFNTVQR